MKIMITGAGGFVGTHLTRFLLEKDHRVVGLGTSAPSSPVSHSNYRFLQADLTESGDWQQELADTDAVVHLAGKTLFRWWTEKHKQAMYDSRIRTTRNLVEALPADRPTVLCSASAVGYYGDRGDDRLTEDEPPGDDFLAGISKDWEAEARRAEEKGARVCIMRFGIVLGPGGGAMAKMLPAFRLCLGGPLGDGGQWFPWIHLQDLLNAAYFLVGNERAGGAYNFTAQPVRQRDFARTLGDVLGRPAVLPAPAFALRAVLGEMAQAFLNSHRAVPGRLVDQGFRCSFEQARDALEDIADTSG